MSNEYTQKKNKLEVLPIRQIYEYGTEFGDRHTSSLYYFLYLTGARISEALEVHGRDIKTEEIDENTVLIVYLKTRKNKKRKYRRIPILIPKDVKTIVDKYEKMMIDYILDYRDQFNEDRCIWGASKEDFNDDIEYKVEKERERQRMKYYFSKIEISSRAITPDGDMVPNYTKPLNAHFLRHCRLSHLVIHYKLDNHPIYLQEFAGWTDLKPAQVYINLGGRKLAEILQEGKRRKNE